MSQLKLNKACAVIHSCNTLEQLSVAERYLDLCKLSNSDEITARILILEKRPVICRQIAEKEDSEMLDKLFKEVLY